MPVLIGYTFLGDVTSSGATVQGYGASFLSVDAQYFICNCYNSVLMMESSSPFLWFLKVLEVDKNLEWTLVFLGLMKAGYWFSQAVWTTREFPLAFLVICLVTLGAETGFVCIRLYSLVYFFVWHMKIETPWWYPPSVIQSKLEYLASFYNLGTWGKWCFTWRQIKACRNLWNSWNEAWVFFFFSHGGGCCWLLTVNWNSELLQVFDSGHPKKICLPEPCKVEVGESTFKFCVVFWQF